jgi:hypothetical protein
MGMTDSAPTPRRYRLTPDRCVIGLLVMEGLLWISDRFQWFWFNEKKGWTVLIGVAVVGVAFLVMLLWFIASLLFRWRFQFSIRSLLVLTIAVALPCSWLGVEMKEAKEQHDVVDVIEKFGGAVGVGYDWEYDATDANRLKHAQPPGPEWLRKLLGSDFFGAVVMLYIYSDEIADAGLAQIAGLTRLQELDLQSTQITDAGLAHLARLTRLQRLSLDGTKITDAGLAHLAGLTRLQWLWLLNNNSQVTDDGVKKLQQALPKCQIVR